MNKAEEQELLIAMDEEQRRLKARLYLKTQAELRDIEEIQGHDYAIAYKQGFERGYEAVLRVMEDFNHFAREHSNTMILVGVIVALSWIGQ